MAEAKHQQVAALLHAGVAVIDICRTLGVSERLIFKVKKLVKQGKDLKIVRTGGPKAKKRTVAAIRRVAAGIRRDPKKSIRKLAAEHKMAPSTMKRIVNEDLGMASRVIQEKPVLTIDAREKRCERAKQLIDRLRKKDSGKVRIFSDEKLFVSDVLVNRRNSRYLTDLPVTEVDESVRICPFSKAPAKVMVLGVIASDGKKCPIIFVLDSEKVTADSYQALLRRHVMPWLSAKFPEGNYVFQQDGAPAHTANSTQTFLAKNMAAHWWKEVWPPYSPDLNPLDYGIWGVLQTKVNATAHENTDSLRRTIRREWKCLSEAMVRQTCRAFRPPLEKVVAADGGYID
jgi:transposase-like protein